MKRWMAMAFLAMTLVIGVAGCDDRNRGPAVLQGVIEGPGPVGAAFFVLPSAGVLAVEPLDGDQVFTRVIPEEGTIRVVLVAGQTGGGSLRFRVRVEDGRGPLPQGTLVELADTQNRRVSGTTGYRIQIRP
jgi:hypothetical protein